MTPEPSAQARPPRLVATDLDGTLVRSDGTVSPYTVEVLAELDRRGIPVVFVTGRPLRWTEEVFSYVGSHGLAIVSNGALVWDVAHHAVHLERTIPARLALEVAGRIRDALPKVRFATETLAGWSAEPGYLGHRADDDPRRRPLRELPLDELVTEPLLKLLALQPGADPDELVAAAEAVAGDLVNITHSSFPLLEISAPEVTKASTLELIARDLGVAAEEVVAFGDMPNDLPMLTWAGTSYAMADAHPAVRTCATNVAPDHDDDGVARVLADLLGL